MIKRLSYIFACCILLALGGCKDKINEPEKPTDDNGGNAVDTIVVPGDTTKNDTTQVIPETPDQRRNLEYLFDLNALPTITITFTQENWQQYLDNFDANPKNDICVPAHFAFNKGQETWQRDSVGVRPRGNTSRVRPEGDKGQPHQSQNADWHHAHFGLKFTEYTTGERFFGCDRIHLKWFHEDPAYCREVYAYDLFRRFGVWTSPRVGYCRLIIKVEGDEKPAYFGVYAMIEGIRKGWLDARFHEGHIPDKDGNLWKAVYKSQGPADLSDMNTSYMGVADDDETFRYNLKTNKKSLALAQNELRSFIEGMRPLSSGSEQLKTYLEQNMDVDLFLRYLAVDVMIGSWDDYWVNANNYYFYFDSNHKFYFIPYDFDNTLGTSHGLMDNPGTHNPLYWGSREGDRLLVRKVLSVKEYEDKYKAYLKQLAADDNLFAADGSKQRITQWHSLISKYVSNDTGEDMQIEDSPASWSSIKQYRLLSGNDKGGNQGDANFFLTKIASLNF